MRQRFLISLACICGVLLVGCTYSYSDDEPIPSASTSSTAASVPQDTTAIDGEVCPFTFTPEDGPVSIHSPSCVPHTMVGGQPMRLDSLPDTGICSIEHAGQAPVVEIDFTRYIGTGLINDPRTGLLIGNGTIVVLPAEAFNLLNVFALEIPNDGRMIYPITPKSHLTLRAALPSLDNLMKSTADQMVSSVVGLEDRTFYLASDDCRPMMVRQ